MTSSSADEADQTLTRKWDSFNGRDSNETYGDLTFKVRPQIKDVRELQFEAFILHAPDTSGQVSTQEWQNTFRADFQTGAYTDDDMSMCSRSD